MKKTWLKKLAGYALSLVGVVAMTSVNSACLWLVHQPEEPEALKKMAE